MKKICFVLDRSESMRGLKLDSAKEGMRRFVEGLYTNRDLDIIGYIDTFISFISFNDIVQVRLTRLHVTDAIPKLKHALERTSPRGMSALWDALGAAVRELREDNKKGDENWIVLLTDGRDNASRKFNLKKLQKYIEKTGVEPRIMIIGLGDSVEEFKLRHLSNSFRGQYVRSSTDSMSILTSFTHVSKSIETDQFTPFTEIDAIKNYYGNLGTEELARQGMEVRPPHETPPERDETDIFKMTLASLRLDLPEAILRLEKARQEECDHEISGVGRSEGVEISGVLNTLTHRILYCKHRKSGMVVQGACTCDDFRHRARKLGIPCKHLWLVMGTGGGGVCAEDRLKGDIARVLAGIEGDMGLDAAQAAKIIGLMQDRLAPLVAKTREARPGRSADPGPGKAPDRQATLENLVLDSLGRRAGGMSVEQLCFEMNVRTEKGKEKVGIVLNFLEMKGKISRKGDRFYFV